MPSHESLIMLEVAKPPSPEPEAPAELLDAPFDVAGVHPTYRGLPYFDLVAKVQRDITRAEPDQLSAVTHVLAGAAVAVRRAV